MARLLATILFLSHLSIVYGQTASPSSGKPSFTEYIRRHLPVKRELDVFLNEMSWAKFDPEVGYVLGNFVPRDGVDESATISTSQPDGTRTSFAYCNQPCRINTYGNSFTLCHQVSDGETWQEYLAAHLGEPIRNYGMGGFGLYQSYRRMLREEQTDNGAEYVMLYIWGDDHRRSLLRCRYLLIDAWNRKQNSQEGIGRMFHGNFWSNIEMNLDTGKLEEHENRLSTHTSLYKMLDPDWMVENLEDDLALEMGLYLRGEIGDVDLARLKRLSQHLGEELSVENGRPTRASVDALLDAYSFAATKQILEKARAFTEGRGKKLMIILLDPYRVTRALLDGGTRYDQEIVDYLKDKNFRTFDMNVVHQEDFKSFNLNSNDYMRRYFIGHYSPAGNHFFAYALKGHVVDWLDPKPVPYRDTQQKIIDFKEYLQGF
ncbi:MAG: hypothetical protein H6823_26055 [Planctomycetaceae bacterium]|nr:hypothetical protein [Planctomycetales bacterium]MCB9941717.1 hypothetical protein [Planctomycetaceae bacterium]